MRRLRAMSIRNQITLLIIIMTLLPLGIILYNAYNQQQHDMEEAIDSSATIARQVEVDQEVLLAGAEQIAASISILPAVKQREILTVNSFLGELVKVNPRIANIMIADKTGLIWASALPFPKNLSYADQRCFINAVATGRISSGEFSSGNGSKIPNISFGFPIKNHSGTVTDVMVAAFPLSWFSSLYSGKNHPIVSSLLLTDFKGIILFSSISSTDVGRQDNTTLFRKMSENSAEGFFEAIGSTGTQQLFSYRKLNLKGETYPYMYIRAGLDHDHVMAKARKDLLIGAAILLPAMFFLLGLAIYSCKRGILDKISILLDATRKIAVGDLDVRIGKRAEGGELEELGIAFDDMVERIQQAEADKREHELIKSGQRFRSFVENFNDVVFALTATGEFTYISPNWKDLFGHALENTIGRPFTEFIHPDDREGFLSLLKRTFETGQKQNGIEYRVLCNNGSHLWYKANVSLIHDPVNETVVFIGIGRDISEYKQSEDKFHTVFHASPDAIILSRFHDGMLMDVNESFTRFTGFSTEQVVGNTERDIGLWNDYSDRARLETVIKKHGEISCFEVYLKLNDGSTRLGQISGRIIYLDGTLCLLGIIRDISEREFILKELIKAQKLESISVLAGGIAHNFNNVMTGVIGYISYAKKHVTETEKVLKVLESAEASALRAADIARQLLTFSQGGQPAKESVLIDSLVHEVVSLFLNGSNVKGDIECISHQTISVDSQQITQAFNNIVLNAVHAMPDGGVLTVRVTGDLLEESNRYSLPPGDYVRIVFRDNGCGIKKDDLVKVFDPYFTTRDSGTGLGLSTTHSIISKHGGNIDITSEIGAGTTVTIILPSLTDYPVHKTNHPSSSRNGQDNGSILVMNGENTKGNLLVNLLEYLGYQTTACSSGKEAITLYKACQEAGEGFRAVIMDLIMPDNMGGVETAKRIYEFDPHACLIASSSSASDPVIENYKSFGFSAVLVKPIGRNELDRALMDAFKECPS